MDKYSTFAIVFGQAIKQLRYAEEVSFEKLAELTGIAKATLSKYEDGTKPVSLQALSVICLTLGAELSRVIKHVENKIEFLQSQGVFVVHEKTPGIQMRYELVRSTELAELMYPEIYSEGTCDSNELERKQLAAEGPELDRAGRNQALLNL